MILLAKAEILVRVVEEMDVVITEIVEKECLKKQELFDSKLIHKLVEDGKIRVEKYKIGKVGGKLIKDFKIGEGEVSSLLLAKKKGCIIATDDGLAIKACKILRIPFLTAVHFLLSLYENRKINRKVALAKVEVLKRVGRYNSEIIRDVLRKIMEKEGLK